jgi:hypothetical protein
MTSILPRQSDPSEKRKRDHAHKELREMIEHTVKFMALFLLLCWTSDQIHNPVACALLRLASYLCVISGASLRMMCIFTNEGISEELIKEVPALGRTLCRYGKVYRLGVDFTLLFLLSGSVYVCAYVRFQ